MKDCQRKLENIKRTIDLRKSRELQINQEILLAKARLRTFQLEKQTAVNAILVIRTLKASQIYLWESSQNSAVAMEMPDQIKDWTQHKESVLFSNSRLVCLWLRIGQLKKEIVRDRNEFMDLQKEMVRLERHKSSREDFIQDQGKKCEELQLLKFGQLVDIDALDKMTLSTVEDDHIAENDRMIKANKKVVQEMLDHHKLLKEKFLNATNENTSLLIQLADLSERQTFYEKQLANACIKQRSRREGSQKMDIEELLIFSQQFTLQAKQINDLRAEINTLKRKTGEF